MPYNRPDDLPKEVLDKYKNPKQRRAFMAAFNSSFESCMSDDGEKDKCEQRAFGAAHTAAAGVKKSLRDQPKMTAVMLRKSRPLIAARNFLQRQFPEGDWTPDDQFHMTMVSLLDEAQHPKLPALDAEPLEIKVTGLSLWETTKDDYAVVFDVEPSPEMEDLQKTLYEHYKDFDRSGYSDPENWIPHITLGYMPTAPDPMPDLDFDPFVIEGKRIELVQKKTTISRKNLHHARSEKTEVKIWQDEWGNLRDGFMPYEQPDVAYDPLGADDLEGCANCTFFLGNACALVMGSISPTGYCDLWQGVEVESEMEDLVEQEMGMMSKLLHAMGLRGKKSIIDGPSGFKVMPGGKRWVGWYSNAYQDKDSEGFPTAAIQRDINRMWADDAFPELWFYHVPGSKHGQADWVGLIGRFVVATGTFDESPLAKAFVKTYSDETMSHGFVYNPERKIDGWYWDYATFEISPTPVGAEANPLTRFEVNDMGLSEKQIAELRERLGPLADPLIEAGKSATAQADASGIAYKASPPSKEDDMKKPSDSEEEDDMKADLEAIKASVSQLTDVVMKLALQPAPAPAAPAPAPDPDTSRAGLSEEMKAQILAHYDAMLKFEERDKSFSEMTLGEQVMTVLQNGGGK